LQNIYVVIFHKNEKAFPIEWEGFLRSGRDCFTRASPFEPVSPEAR
jgi:hypothetical protein